MVIVVSTEQIVIIAAVVVPVPLAKGILLVETKYPNAVVQGRADQTSLVHQNQIEKSDQQPIHFRTLHRLVFELTRLEFSHWIALLADSMNI